MPAAALADVPHQHVSRDGSVVTETLFGDSIVRFLYSRTRERAPWLFRAATSRQVTHLLATLNFDSKLGFRLLGNKDFLARCGVDLAECVDPPESFDTPRKVFMRKIRFWDSRPLPSDPRAIVSPADAYALWGSLADDAAVRVKETFFRLEELVGRTKPEWQAAFAQGEFAVFRLTPDKYHYNHAPVSGRVLESYEIQGRYHACNPCAVVEVASPLSKNGRTVTVIDTDVPGGTGVGLVAMIEVVALMIGRVEQRYSAERYEDPQPLRAGQWLRRGAAKSVYHPGSSTTVLLFQRERVEFSETLQRNVGRADVSSRYRSSCGAPVIETEVALREAVARPKPLGASPPPAWLPWPTGSRPGRTCSRPVGVMDMGPSPAGSTSQVP